MNLKLLVKNLLTLALLVIVVTGCGGAEPAAEPSGIASQEAPAAGFTPSAVCIVPDVVGLNGAIAESTLVATGLQPVRQFQHNDSVAENAIISQEPATGTRLEPCEGDVVIVISLGPVPLPTETPRPTDTPSPTETLAPPTETPMPTPLPPTATLPPDGRLFNDDFETGVRPEWGFFGQDFSVANGKLVVENGSIEGSIGDVSWINYRIVVQGRDSDDTENFEILVRVQDRDNYMMFKCRSNNCDWYKVIQGETIKIPGTSVGWDSSLLSFEVETNIYRVFHNNEQKLYFVDDTFSSGGVGLRYSGRRFEIESFEVKAMP